MNFILAALLLAAIYLFLEAGLVFFALIVGVALLLGLVSSAFSPREGAPSQSLPPKPPEFVKHDHGGLQKLWMTVGMVFNFIGRATYRFLRYGFQAGGKKHD